MGFSINSDCKVTINDDRWEVTYTDKDKSVSISVPKNEPVATVKDLFDYVLTRLGLP